MTSLVRFRTVALLSALAVLLALAGSAAGKPTAPASTAVEKAPTDTAVFFAADGLRQDLVAHYAADGLMPTMSSFLRHGVSATDNGLLTQAPQLTELVRQTGVEVSGTFRPTALPYRQADVVTHQIADPERTHREPE